MARPKQYERPDVARLAMAVFWEHGYYSTSIDHLVGATGVSRHGLYAEFADKEGIFVAAAAVYVDEVVTPAFGVVEQAGAGLREVRQFIHTQIDRAAEGGLPGPGCLMANLMVEAAPHIPRFAELVRAHLNRLTRGFELAIAHDAKGAAPTRKKLGMAYAPVLTIGAQGLWSHSRMEPDVAVLRRFADTLVDNVEARITP